MAMIARRKKATPNPAVILDNNASNPLFFPNKREEPPPREPKPSSLLGRIVTKTIKAKETINNNTEKKFIFITPLGYLLILFYQRCPGLTSLTSDPLFCEGKGGASSLPFPP